MKGIILAGGSGSRLAPMTQTLSKQILPVYDKPMIFYPLSVLMLAGIRDVLVISTPRDLHSFKLLLGNGDDLGMRISYKEQPSPDGLAQAFIIGEEFIGTDSVCLVLGDNIFFGHGLREKLEIAGTLSSGAKVFCCSVPDPERYGIAAFDKDYNVLSIEEKPTNPKSNFAITGLYFYDNSVIDIAKKITPSSRGELEITSVNQEYLKKGSLTLDILSRGYAWFDTGTHDSLLEASNFIQTVEKRQGLKIACLEEIAFNKGWIDTNSVLKAYKRMKNSDYGEHLRRLVK